MNIRTALVAVSLAALAPATTAQDETEPTAQAIRVTPGSLTMEVGDTAQLTAEAVGADGEPVDVKVFFFSRNRRSVRVDSKGVVHALKPGEFTVVARTPRRRGDRVSVTIPVQVAFPPVTSVALVDPPQRLYAGVTRRLQTRVLDASGSEREDVTVALSVDDPERAAVDAFGNLTARSPGTAAVRVEAEGLVAHYAVRIEPNPVRGIDLDCAYATVRTGDVLRFEARALDGAGAPVADAPVHYSFEARPDDDLAPAASGQIEQDGRFVAEQPGLYTIVATCGPASARKTVRIVPREVQQRIDLIGRGAVSDVHTSDLWVWEGVDGRDYAVTGTWGANGEAHFWDVTDPGDIQRISTVTVDARTVNDVKVSEDGRLCVISREGASNRRNGIVLIDVSDPRRPAVLSTFDEDLTGGVHNLFIWNDHVFALSAGRRYDVIDVSDPKSPHRVGSFELDTPGHSIHDVWVEDGIAYSSNWSDGVQIVDVGNGVAGGTPANPVKLGSYTYPSGWNHAAFPYRDAETGRFYVIAGDEAFPYGLNLDREPTYARGWIHFIDFTDMENPREVARYQVPEAGTHNFWVEGDLLYTAYYNGGLRVVDISGELMGDLYRQGREVAWYLPADPEGYIPNAPMVWGPQPHKGHVFFSDWNSGLWAVQLVDETSP